MASHASQKLRFFAGIRQDVTQFVERRNAKRDAERAQAIVSYRLHT
jgi:hypothetical protein